MKFYFMTSFILLMSISTYFYMVPTTTEQKFILNTCSYQNNYLTNYYLNYKTKHLGDSGIDLVIPYNTTIQSKSYQIISYHTQFVMTKQSQFIMYQDKDVKSYSFFLFPRSSMQNYPLIYVNGVGIIDAGFRGNLSSMIYNPNNYAIELFQGTKLVQICANDLSEIIVKVNCDVGNYGTRGLNSFGSTS